MVLVVTNRLLCEEPFIERINRIASARPDALILREKDMTDEEYLNLARICRKICDTYGVKLIVNSRIDIAKTLGLAVHVPAAVLRDHVIKDIPCMGASIHSKEELMLAQREGAQYVIAGHIFETHCKKGLQARGLDYLKQVCQSANVPVFAIGGLEPFRAQNVMRAGASGVCIMSSAMTHPNPTILIEDFRTQMTLT